MSKSDRQAALEASLKQIEKQFGKGSIMRLGDGVDRSIVKSSTGSIAIDSALGGGYPKGRIVEIYGPESSGKTTVTLHAIAEIQKAGGQAAFIDAEHALDPVYAGKLGVDVANLLVSQPDNGEQALEIAESLVNSGAVDIVVIDSVAALVPRAEIEGNMGDSHMGLQARLMSQALRKLSGTISKTNTLVIFINQVREKIGVMFGNPETTTGGRALKFYASQRLEVRKGESIKNGTEIVAHKTKVKIVKNKVAPPFRTCEIMIEFGKGINIEHEIIELGQSYKNSSGKNFVVKSGSWFSYTDQNNEEVRIGQGAENSKEFLKANPDIFEYLKSSILNAIKKEQEDSMSGFTPAEEEEEFNEDDVE